MKGLRIYHKYTRQYLSRSTTSKSLLNSFWDMGTGGGPSSEGTRWLATEARRFEALVSLSCSEMTDTS